MWTGVVLGAFLAFARPSYAEEAVTATAEKAAIQEGGWNTQYGLLFEFNNPLQIGLGGPTEILSSFEGGLGGMYNLDPQTTIRVGLQLNRWSNPSTFTKNTLKNGATTVVTYDLNDNDPTATTDTQVSADYLMRMSKHAFSPYFGGGAVMGWSTYEQKYTDDVTVVDQTTTVKNFSDTFFVRGRGILGIGWRIHEHFEIFAEYALGLTLFSVSKDKQQTTVANSAGGVTSTVQYTRQTNYTKWFNWDLSLAHGPSLGLVAFF